MSNTPRIVHLQVAVGVVAVIVTIIAAAQLPPLLTQKQTLETEVVTLGSEKDKLATDLENLHDAIRELKAEQAELLNNAFGFKVAASRKPIPANESPKPGIRKYSLWLDGDPKSLEAITRVTYDMKDESFAKPLFTSSDRTNKFLISYNGIEDGCIYNVAVTVQFAAGHSIMFRCDQCDTIPASDWDDAPQTGE